MFDKSEELQKQMAELDLPNSRSSNGPYFLVLKLQNMKIKMYEEKHHQKPHIHIGYGVYEHAASFCIETGNRLIGNKKELAKKYDKIIRNWISENKAELMTLWTVTQQGGNNETLIAALRSNT